MNSNKAHSLRQVLFSTEIKFVILTWPGCDQEPAVFSQAIRCDAHPLSSPRYAAVFTSSTI